MKTDFHYDTRHFSKEEAAEMLKKISVVFDENYADFSYAFLFKTKDGDVVDIDVSRLGALRFLSKEKALYELIVRPVA